MLEISGLTWAVTIGVIVALLALDLALAALRPHRVGLQGGHGLVRVLHRWSRSRSAPGCGWPHGSEFGTEYLAGYIVEKSLSVDNLFVFVIIMTTFAVPEEHQHKVLTFGIVLALIMRAIFIALGATLLSLFSFMFLIFGLLLIYTAVQLFRHRDEDPDVEDNGVVKAARRLLPVTDEYVGGKLVTRVDGRKMVTPLFIVLVAIGGIDLLFALDSIPAVFGVTQEAYIVFAANAFALLGLRALFFLVKGLLDRLVYLSTGLSLILAFIGVKLILHWLHVDISDVGAGDLDAGQPRGDPGGPDGGDGREPAQDPQRPRREGARRLAASVEEAPRRGRALLTNARHSRHEPCDGVLLVGLRRADPDRRAGSDRPAPAARPAARSRHRSRPRRGRRTAPGPTRPRPTTPR